MNEINNTMFVTNDNNNNNNNNNIKSMKTEKTDNHRQGNKNMKSKNKVKNRPDSSSLQVVNNTSNVAPEVRYSKKTIFVTVGTTKFDKLINKFLDQEFIEALNELKYTNLIIQTGMSEYRKPDVSILKAEIYDYKQSITEDIEMADLVVGHAGAGTCLEVLRKKKKLLVVTNEDLMGNHQFELAQQLSDDKYLMACNINNLKEALIRISRPNIKFNVFPQQDVNKMANILDGILA